MRPIDRVRMYIDYFEPLYYRAEVKRRYGVALVEQLTENVSVSGDDLHFKDHYSIRVSSLPALGELIDALRQSRVEKDAFKRWCDEAEAREMRKEKEHLDALKEWEARCGVLGQDVKDRDRWTAQYRSEGNRMRSEIENLKGRLDDRDVGIEQLKAQAENQTLIIRKQGEDLDFQKTLLDHYSQSLHAAENRIARLSLAIKQALGYMWTSEMNATNAEKLDAILRRSGVYDEGPKTEPANQASAQDPGHAGRDQDDDGGCGSCGKEVVSGADREEPFTETASEIEAGRGPLRTSSNEGRVVTLCDVQGCSAFAVIRSGLVGEEQIFNFCPDHKRLGLSLPMKREAWDREGRP